MKGLMLRFRRFLVEEDGPATVEYAVLLALILIIAMPAITALGERVRDIYRNVAAALPEVEVTY